MVPEVRLPARSDRGPRSAFGLGREARPLRLVFDVDSLDALDVVTSILQGFVWHPDVDVRQLHLPQVVLNDEGGARIEENGGERCTFAPYVSNREAVAKAFRGAWPLDDEHRKRLALTCYAETVGADALVTASADLLDIADETGFRAANIVDPSRAAALVGLFLRHRHDFTYARGETWEKTQPRSSFYELHATLLLPNLGRWLVRCPEVLDGCDRRPRSLAEATCARLGNALRARDALLAHLLMDVGHEPPDDALLHLDTLLVALRGAFDVAAGLTHIAYALPEAGHPGWQNNGWCRSLKAAAPALKAQVLGGGLVHDTFAIVNWLRDFVHSEPFEPVFDVDGRDVHNGNLLVPSRKGTDRFFAAIDAQGGREAWGIEPLGDDNHMLVLHRFVERVLPWTAAALDVLCQRVEVERFGVGTADDERTWMSAFAARTSDGAIPTLVLGGVGPRPHL